LKRCPHCGETKPLDAFSRQSSKKDGKYTLCKPCNSAYKRKRLAEDGDAIRARVRERVRAKRAADPEKIRAWERAWRASNRERLRKYLRDWKAAHPESVAVDCARRRAVARHRFGWGDVSGQRQIYRIARGLRALGVEVHIDHAVPLRSKKVVGLHVYCNLRLAYGKANLSKGNRSWPDHLDKMPGQFHSFRWPRALTGQAACSRVAPP
jgi:hypothetical protein